MTLFNVWYTSAPVLSASRKLLAPTGRIMNSWHASLLPAWLPPLITLKHGTGMTNLSVERPERYAIYSYKGICMDAAPARQIAMETANIAFAPKVDFDQPQSFCVPSRVSTISLSISLCFVTSIPTNLGPIMLFTLSTALRTPLPNKRFLSPSRSSRASYTPVEAPLGTAARNRCISVSRSTSTVGLPRESKISRALMLTTFAAGGTMPSTMAM
mmetsp:Transcript_43808/g.69337  ORF Transcript_43808/g.69337 Transcript_43808/m.69337 type:complete len:214 (-) Transcript_43808:1051-1692(-)